MTDVASAPSPPQPPPLLVLDLDETLVSSRPFCAPTFTDTRAGPPYEPCDVLLPGGGAPIEIYVRPHACAFLARLRPHYRLAVWSAGQADYVHAIVQQLFGDFQFEFVRTHQDCAMVLDVARCQSYIVKPLALIDGVDLDRTLVVDNESSTADANVDNHVPIASFDATRLESDYCLPTLAEFLVRHCAVADMRALPKRNWLLQMPLPHWPIERL